ncbi:MAG: M20/M25/M40 family metallo-hydrolase, partial [Deltaproteobacteria bacterium]
ALRNFRQRLEQQPAHPLCGKTTLSLTSLHAGSSSNIIPDECALTVDIRLPPGYYPEDVYKQLGEILPEDATMELLFGGQGMETDYNLPIIQTLADSVRDHGITPGPDAAAYATDCCRLASRGPCIVWGPGSIEQAHQHDEFIEVDQIALAVGILQKFFCGK